MDKNYKVLLTFWDICLANFSIGKFTHQELSEDEAKQIIHNAKKYDQLYCASDEDLCAPYKARELDKYKKLCEILEQRFDIPVSISDFMIQEDDSCIIRPLQIVQVDQHNRLLVIDCCFYHTIRLQEIQSFHHFAAAATAIFIFMDTIGVLLHRYL